MINVKTFCALANLPNINYVDRCNYIPTHVQHAVLISVSNAGPAQLAHPHHLVLLFGFDSFRGFIG